MKKFLILILSAALFSGTAAEVKSSGDRIILTNSKLSAEINLTLGGRIGKLTDLGSKCELTELNSQPGGSGLFGDTLFNPVNQKVMADFRKQRYKLISIQKGTVIRVSLQSPEGNPVTIRKTYILDDSGTLKVEYELTNPGNKEITGLFRNNFGFRFSGERKYTVQFPEGKRNSKWQEPVAAPGSNRLVYDTDAGKSADLFFFRVKRDYAAVIGTHSGVVVNTPFPVLDYFYTYQSADSNGMAITDWFTTPFCLPPLSKGEAEAVLLAVMDDPLAKYKYRFTVSVSLVSPKTFVYEKYREPSKEKKLTDFLPISKLDEMHADFNTPALIINPKPVRRLRILAIAAAHGNHEMGELNRRLNHDMNLLDTSNTSRFAATPYFGWNLPEPEKMLDILLRQSPEIILVCGHHEKSISRPLLERIIRQVESGAAFIYVSENNSFPSLIPPNGGKEASSEIYAGILREKLPAFGKILEYRRGKGRVFHVRFPMAPHKTEWVREARVVVPYAPSVTADFPYWEYYFAFYGKLFRYAAGQIPSAQLKQAEVTRGKIHLEIETRKPLSNASIQLTADTPTGRIDCGKLWQGKLQQGRKSLELTLPETLTRMDGEYRLHFLLSDRQFSLDWYATAFHHRAEAGLESITLNGKIFRKGEPAEGTLRIRGGGTLLLHLRETASGRTLAVLKEKAVAGEMRFSLKRQIPSNEKVYLLEASLYRDGHRVSTLRQTILMEPERTDTDKIHPLIWGAHFATWRDHLLNRELADCGFDIYLAPMASTKNKDEIVSESLSVQQTGMEYAPLGVEHVKASTTGKSSSVRNPCLRNPDYLQRVSKKTDDIVKKMKESLTKKCFISDEMTLGTYHNTPHDYCMSPWCLAAFREYLRKKYSENLKKLNRNWGTKFTSWDQVKPFTHVQSRAKNSFVSFIEHRIFMFTNMTDLFRMISDKIHADVGGTTGVSGMEMIRVYQGFDLIESMKYLKSSAYYHLPFTLDSIRSFTTGEHLAGSFTDYGLRYGIWEQLIGGLRMPSVWWYGHLMRRGDGRLSKEGEHLRRIFSDIRNSGADLVLGSGHRAKAGIALLWSIPNLVAASASFYPSPVNELRYKNSVNSWSQLIRDMGLDSPDVITPEQLSRVTLKQYPVLVLILAQQLSDQDIDALKDYVRAGGLLIADYAPGLRDQFGVIRKENPLNEVFGITLRPAENPGSGSLQINGKSIDGMTPGEPLEVKAPAQALASLRTTIKGVRLGGIRMKDYSREIAPAAILNPYGKGKALYLNFLLDEYHPFTIATGKPDKTEGRNDGEFDHPVIQGMRDIFQAAGINLTDAHKLPCGSNYAAYEHKGIRYLFLSRRKNWSRGQYTLRLNRTFHVYDLLRGKSLGSCDQISSVLEPAGVRVYALHHKPLPQFSAEIQRKGRIMVIDCGAAEHPGTLFRIKVCCNGRELRKLSRTVTPGELVEIDPGLEPSGEWEISVTRIADRQTRIRIFRYQ